MIQIKKSLQRQSNGEIEKCIINYALPNEYIEIDPQKNYRYIMCLDDMLEIDKNYILANQIVGGYRL